MGRGVKSIDWKHSGERSNLIEYQEDRSFVIGSRVSIGERREMEREDVCAVEAENL